MYKKNKILGIIPARGGSKRLPKKNIKILGGLPLIAYAIFAMKKSKYIDRIIVSTDDKKISAIAKKYGAEVPFLRPKNLSSDTASSAEVLVHAVNFLEKQKSYFDYIVLVQPTSPFVYNDDIDKAILKLIKTGANSCASVCEITDRPEWMYILNNDSATPYVKNQTSFRQQDMPKIYRLNGAVYCVRNETLIKRGLIIDKNSLQTVIMPKERSIDIDDIYDFRIAETILKYHENNKIKK